jgi:hypothetical protein
LRLNWERHSRFFFVYPQRRAIRHVFINNWIERISTSLEKLLSRFADITTVSGMGDDKLKPCWSRPAKSLVCDETRCIVGYPRVFPAKLSRTKRDRNLLRDCGKYVDHCIGPGSDLVLIGGPTCSRLPSGERVPIPPRSRYESSRPKVNLIVDTSN